MRAVNLLPADRRVAASRSVPTLLATRPTLVGAVAAAVVVTSLLAFAWHGASSAVSSKQTRLHDLQGQLAALRPAVQASSATASHLTAVTQAAAAQTSWDGFLTTVSRVLPEDVWLLGLNASGTAAPADVGAAPAAVPLTGGTFSLNGYTYSQRSVARLMSRLALVPWLSNVRLQQSERAALGTRTVFQFTVAADLTTPKGAS